ncbi:protein-glutamate methylesterase/protein-glutamine glutaminase [Saccharospirillum salsuginis]|uniref:Protein-glutamate methylesterase/protein-glutamine glutaminase n=1 Tax=Saccharospirillum salsuginis TaxID=418750 RepID=A0A918K5S9_9GAMM|nr:chemotaxis response regulator protein-glutamate methylesterase [Saccharospirillum salsuginis]GGX50848.1 chemotaxis response regulator protein-glutamate methylesterase of group 1 operon [Saccharospirillum salsuginis]
MPISVLIVDDSSFFRVRIRGLINSHPQLNVIGEATNGREAVEKAVKLKPDVITMDYEMPMMDGISAVREIMTKQPTPILMFSSLTQAGARVTLDALDAGAVDYLPKSYENVAGGPTALKKALCEKIIAIAGQAKPRAMAAATAPAPAPAAPRKGQKRYPQRFDLVMLGTSTGGPVALQKILTQIPANFPAPILMIQHMPGSFTGAFADRLNRQCKITVREAADGDTLRPGEALLAPGGKQMMLAGKGRIRVFDGDERLNYKPSVDVTFGSAVKYYGKNILAVVLTGMGADGREGARLIKQTEGVVWAQESSTCVIDGMPSAIVKANLADETVPLNEVARRLVDVVTG